MAKKKAMNIWIDISNSPHINFFYDLIKDLENDGHVVTITSRPLANTVALLDQRNLHHTVIGKHYGKNFYKKIMGFPIRIFQLYRFLRARQIDVAIGQSSFHLPITARLIRAKAVYTNDNEHALGNIPSFFFANRILVPESMKESDIWPKYLNKVKVVRYPGIKEGIYLWRQFEVVKEARSLNKGISATEIFIRPEPLTAQYYRGGTNFLDTLIMDLQNEFQITVLPRDKTQYTHYQQKKFSRIQVAAVPLPFEELSRRCSIFIGAGGSMTREFAVLGIPCVSVYQDSLLEVDRVLIESGLLLYNPSITAAEVKAFLKAYPDREASKVLVEKGKAAYQILKSSILS